MADYNDETPMQRSDKRQPPEHTVIISFSIFCTGCGKELRVVTEEDRTGDMNFCDNCGSSVRTAVGIAVNANTKEEIHYAMMEMRQHLPLIHKVLSEWNPANE